jgi:hypothetical protein
MYEFTLDDGSTRVQPVVAWMLKSDGDFVPCNRCRSRGAAAATSPDRRSHAPPLTQSANALLLGL